MHLLSAQSARPYEYIQQHAGRRERGEEKKKKSETRQICFMLWALAEF